MMMMMMIHCLLSIRNYDDDAEMGPIFVSGAMDGSVNVLSLTVETSGHEVSVTGR